MEESVVVIDIESCANTTKEAGCPDISNDKFENTLPVTFGDTQTSIDENSGNPSADGKNVPSKSEKRFSMSAKKPPKPPRPPRGLSLDAADQKLIKEISELVVLKRARIERMKALKKTKAAKASPGSSSSGGNLIAMVFTVLFCIVIIFQGCHPSRSFLSSNNSSAGGIVSSRKPNGATEGNIAGVGPPSFMQLAPEKSFR